MNDARMEVSMEKLFYGGDIITMENETDAPEAVLVKNGVIDYTGSLEGAKAAAGTGVEMINLEGKTLMPSFIDPHGHISMMAQFSSFCDLSECTSLQQIIDALLAYKEQKKIDKDGIILGFGYDHNFLEEQCHPTKFELDQVSAEIPIYVFHTSGHMGAGNSALLALAGVNRDTMDPAGGKLGRTEDGNPNGYLEEGAAMGLVLMPAFSRMKGDFVQQVLAAQQVYLKYGVTTVQDGAASIQNVQGLTAIAENNMLKLDVVSYVMTNDYAKAISEYEKVSKDYYKGFRIGGAKIVLDGSPQGRSAWLSKPYEGEAEYCGYPSHEDSYVEEQMKAAVEGEYQILTHCNGDAASEQLLNAYEKALKEAIAAHPEKKDTYMSLRPVMIHCQTVRDDQLDRMAEMKMIPSIFVCHTYYWGDVHLKNLGPVRGAHVSPAKAALERGLVYNFHQDPPVTKPDMLRTIWSAVNRITREGQPIGQDQCIGVYDALKGVTINAAYEYGEENKKGSIKAGKTADLVILDSNPLKVDKLAIADIKVLETIKAGEVVYTA